MLTSQQGHPQKQIQVTLSVGEAVMVRTALVRFLRSCQGPMELTRGLLERIDGELKAKVGVTGWTSLNETRS